MINDVSCLSDPRMAATVADHGAGLVAMASLGSPSTMYRGDDAVERIIGSLAHAVEVATDAGIADDDIFLDPGIGFGTTHQQSWEILHCADRFSCGGHKVLIGPSRKRFLREYYPGTDPDAATAEACRIAWDHGADALRVHDPKTVIGRLRFTPSYPLPRRSEWA